MADEEEAVPARPAAPRCERCGQPLVLGECGMCRSRGRAAAASAAATPETAAVPAATGTAAGAAGPVPRLIDPSALHRPEGQRAPGTQPDPSTLPPLGARAASPSSGRVQPSPTAPMPAATTSARPVAVGERPDTLMVVLLALVALLLVGSGYLVLTVSSLKSKVSGLEAQAQSASDQQQQTVGQIKVIDDAEKQLAQQLTDQAAADPAAIATKVQPSVWTIATRSFLGSGWVVQSDATSSTFITNFHVIAEAVNDGSNLVKVFQDEGAQLDGTIGAYDQVADLAVVTVPGHLPSLSLSNVTPLPGAPVLVVGSPLGLGGSVTTGATSAIRDIDGIKYVQFSAPISPGNSGGPLVNSAGQVIGVTVAKAVGGGAEGIGLAIPVSQVCDRLKFCP